MSSVHKPKHFFYGAEGWLFEFLEGDGFVKRF